MLMQCVTPVRLDNTAVVNIRDTFLTFGNARRMAQLCRNSARGVQKSAGRACVVLCLFKVITAVCTERMSVPVGGAAAAYLDSLQS